MIVHSYNHSAGAWGRREPQRLAGFLSQSLVRQLSPSVNSRFNEKTVSKIRVEGDRGRWTLVLSLHVYTFTSMNTHTVHTQREGS